MQHLSLDLLFSLWCGHHVGLYSPMNSILERITNPILIASSKIMDGFNCIQLKKKNFIHYHFGLFAYQHVK